MSLSQVPGREEMASLFAQHRVVLAYLFGSQAQGTAQSRSDIDVAVLLDERLPAAERGQRRLLLTNALMDLFHHNDVDVVLLDQATPLLAWQVLRHGRCLYAADDSVRVRFALDTLHRYEDTRNLRQIRRHYLGRRIAQSRPGSERGSIGGADGRP